MKKSMHMSSSMQASQVQLAYCISIPPLLYAINAIEHDTVTKYVKQEVNMKSRM